MHTALTRNELRKNATKNSIRYRITFSAFPSDSNKYFDVYVVESTKDESTPVLLLHELPGLNCKAIRFANLLAAKGYTVYLPHLLGEAGTDSSFTNSVKLMFDSRWSVYSESEESEIVNQIEQLANKIHADSAAQIGVIGMCLTGTFPIAIMHNPGVGAVVVAQPATPLLSVGSSRKAALGISEARLQKAVDRGDVPILGFRYQEDDWVSPGEKFVTLRDKFKSDFIDCSITEKELTLDLHEHSVLTEEYGNDESNNRVDKTIEFFDIALGGKGDLNSFVCPEPGWLMQ